MGAKVFTRPQDRDLLLSDYRKTITHGFSGMRDLDFSRRAWNDVDMTMLAETLKEVECPHVVRLSLSANDMSAKGLEALGHAVASGAIHSLSFLDLSDCSAVRTIPETLCALKQLDTLRLDGCLGLSALPAAITEGKMGALRHLNITHCIRLLQNEQELEKVPKGIEVVKDKERS